MSAKLWMTDEEIWILCRDSINRSKEIKILAQLNVCTEADIQKALSRYKVHLDELDSRQKEWDRIEAYRKTKGL